jgi:hypothetical protein
MSASHFHRSPASFCVSDALDALGEDICSIREEDGLRWQDVGRELGKCKDRAIDYSKGLSDMPLSAFLLGCRKWNGRFDGRVLAMIGMKLAPLDRPNVPDRSTGSTVLKAALALSVALEDDGQITPDEILANRATIENARDALDGLLASLAPRRQA